MGWRPSLTLAVAGIVHPNSPVSFSVHALMCAGLALSSSLLAAASFLLDSALRISQSRSPCVIRDVEYFSLSLQKLFEI